MGSKWSNYLSKVDLMRYCKQVVSSGKFVHIYVLEDGKVVGHSEFDLRVINNKRAQLAHTITTKEAELLIKNESKRASRQELINLSIKMAAQRLK